jgi:hypothetical protein
MYPGSVANELGPIEAVMKLLIWLGLILALVLVSGLGCTKVTGGGWFTDETTGSKLFCA